jgi:hypothetical protein
LKTFHTEEEKMTVFKVTKRRVEEDYFFVRVDTTDLDEEYVVINGPKETEQLQTLLMKANCSSDVVRGPKRESWIFAVPHDSDMNRSVVGNLEFVKKFYAKVEFTVKHTITRLVEVMAPNRREAAEVISQNLEDDMPEILESLAEDVYDTGNLDSQECEVLGWGTNPEHLMLNHSKPVKTYKQED